MRTLYVIYGAGYAAVFLILTLLYLHGWRKREEVALDPLECIKTRSSLIDHSAMTIVGVTSALLAVFLPPKRLGFAGYFYFVVGVYLTLPRSVQVKRERLLVAQTEETLVG